MDRVAPMNMSHLPGFAGLCGCECVYLCEGERESLANWLVQDYRESLGALQVQMMTMHTELHFQGQYVPHKIIYEAKMALQHNTHHT